MEDILLWSKGQMVTFKPHIKTLSIHSVFMEMQLLYAGNGRVRILFNNPQNLQINTDEDYLKTILRNLTSNAIKAVDGRPDALIEWKAWRDNQQAGLSLHHRQRTGYLDYATGRAFQQ
jgi:signal transduction histidine kinase